jgi:hypothetical protein
MRNWAELHEVLGAGAVYVLSSLMGSFTPRATPELQRLIQLSPAGTSSLVTAGVAPNTDLRRKIA